MGADQPQAPYSELPGCEDPIDMQGGAETRDVWLKYVGLKASRRAWMPIWVAVLWLTAAGCSALPAGESFTFVVPPRSAEIGSVENLLVIREDDGNLAVLNPETGNRTRLTSDASRTVMYDQPVWAPASGRLAWVRSELRGPALRGRVMVADTEGNVQIQVETSLPPFYMYWNPTGARLSLLGNWSADGVPTIALTMIDTNGPAAGRLRLWETGQPYYYAWAPDGKRLIVHRDENTVWAGLAEEPRLLTVQAAGFGAPVWLAGTGSDEVMYGELRDGIAALVRANLETAAEEVLTWYQGSHLALYPNPQGNRLAIVETRDTMAVNAFGPLYVYFLDQGAMEQITTLPVIAAFWSPDGARLLFWEVGEDGDIGNFRLRVWDDAGIRDLALVTVTPNFLRRYLVFSDQYALSHTLWSADSRMIAFATRSAAGENEIYVQDVAAGTRPERVAAGDLVFWSRQAPAE